MKLCFFVSVSVAAFGAILSQASVPQAQKTQIAAFFSPHGGYDKSAPDCVSVVVSEILSAKDEILVRAYGFTSKPIGDALVAAAAKNLKVRIICDRSERKNKNSIAPVCSAAGCEVTFDDNHPISHSKVMIFDRKRSLVGSYNWTGNAEKNAETMLLISDSTLAEKLAEDWKHHREHSTPAIK